MRPTNNNGSIIIRFTKFGYKYSLTNLGKFNDSTAYREAMSICESIQVDIRLGRFSPKTNEELFKAYHPLANLARHMVDSRLAVDCLETVEETLASKSLRDRNLHQTKNFLVKYGKPIKSSDDALKFWQWLQLTSKGNNKTINRHLESLKPICDYFRDIPKLKTKQGGSEKPFSKSEIKSISDIFSTKYQDYLTFVHFLFSTGVRPNEATALTWDCLDWDNSTVTIKQAIGVASDGSKVTKETKTGVARVVPLTLKLKMSLAAEYEIYTKKGLSHNLVFSTPSGSVIDLGNFRARVWIKALQDAKVPYRTIYNTRHTFCSHFLNETPDFIKLASLTHGTKSGVQTLVKHYAHLVSDISMPDMF
jgi:integrase